MRPEQAAIPVARRHWLPGDAVTEETVKRAILDIGWAIRQAGDPAIVRQVQALAMAGNARAQVRMAEKLKWYSGEPIDWEAVRGWLFLAESQGDAEAPYHLACMYLYGSGCDKDWKKSATYYSACHAEYEAIACYQTGYMYYHGGYGIERDHACALQYFMQSLSASGENPLYLEQCCYYLGLLYLAGEVVAHDPFIACVYLGMAAHPWSVLRHPPRPADVRPPPSEQPFYFIDAKGEKTLVLGGSYFLDTRALLSPAMQDRADAEIARRMALHDEAVLRVLNAD